MLQGEITIIVQTKKTSGKRDYNPIGKGEMKSMTSIPYRKGRK